jgi:hypothetical protein
VFKLSSQGQRNDISASTTVASTAAYAKKAVTTTTTATLVAITLSPTTTAPTTHSTVAMTAPKAVMTVVEDKPEHRFDCANESVQYHHHFDGDSCHGCVDQVSVLGKSLPSVRPSFTIPPPWVHVFSKSCQPSSLRTQAASIAYMEDSIHTKARHRRNRRRRKKLIKQEKILTEVILPHSIQQNLLSASIIDQEIVVVDGADDGNPPICPPEGVNWRVLSVRDAIHLHVQDEHDPLRGLTFRRVDGVLPFARLPRAKSLDVLKKMSMKEIISALEACEKLKRTPLRRGDHKHIFSDYGKRVMYTSAGVQVSRNSRGVLDCNAYMEDLPDIHATILMKLMRHAEYCLETIVDNDVICHLYHAKKLVPFKTMNVKTASEQARLKYYGSLAFGCNVFLQCHTDSDYTMSMAHIHLKGKDKYELTDEVVIYFCFPTLGVAVPLRPGDFLIFNALIPHCVSSRCRQVDEVMVISMYLKSAVVGLNNNVLPLNSKQIHLARRYNELNKN